MAELTSGFENQTRMALLIAARHLTVTHGWAAVRMGAVADAAGVSRQTLYNEFVSKAGLARALANTEGDHFVAGVTAALTAAGPDAATAIRAAVTHALREAATNPLVADILAPRAGGTDSLLPFLTTRAGQILAAATAAIATWAAEHYRGVPADRLRFAAESIVRLTISHILLPPPPGSGQAEQLADTAATLLAHA